MFFINEKRGFVALFTVVMMGLFAVIAVLISSPQVWLQSSIVYENRDRALAHLNALSCLNIARGRVFEYIETGNGGGGGSGDVDIHEIVGNYSVFSDNCIVNSVERMNDDFVIEVISTKNKARISLRAIFSETDYVFHSVSWLH